jgi:hypothetical protein
MPSELAPLLHRAERGPNQGRFPGEAVAEKWESSHGHAHAAFRYGLMSRPSPSTAPKQRPEDPRAAWLQEVEERWEERTESGGRWAAV